MRKTAPKDFDQPTLIERITDAPTIFLIMVIAAVVAAFVYVSV